MKKKILLSLVVPAMLLSSCGGESSTNKPSDATSVNSTVSKTSETSTSGDSSAISTSNNTSQQESISSSDDTKAKLAQYKTAALNKLDEIVYPYIAKIPHEELKTKTQEYYDSEKQYVNDIVDLNTAKMAVDKIISDTKSFAINTLKPLAIAKINEIINPLIEEIPYEPLKTSVQSFYDTEMTKLSSIESLGEVVTIYQAIISDIKTYIEDETKKTVIDLKNTALEKLDEIVNPVIAKITNEDLKTSVQNYYNTEMQYLYAITDIDTAKDAVNKVIADTKTFALNTLKPLAIEKLNETINPLISQITNESLKTSVQSYYDTEMNKISSIESLDDVITVFNEIVEDTKKFIQDETEKLIIEAKNKALEELDPYVTALIAKIPYESVQTFVQTFYTQEKAKLEAVDTLDGFEPCILEIKDDLVKFALSETKSFAVSKLQEVVDEYLAKLPNETIKKDLTEFSNTEISKLNAIENLEDIPTTLETVLKETREHATKLLGNIVKDYLSRLLKIETATAYDYLPDAMEPTYANNVVDASSIAYDFTTSTKVSSINKAGYGEQWQMVVENINQSVMMAKVFNVAQTALNAAGNAVDIYIENSYAEEMDYSFSGTGFTGQFIYKDSKLTFNVTLTEAVTVPGIGEVKPVIKMEYDLIKEAKGMYISLGDAYKLKYVISDKSYEMATTYGVTLAGKSGSRSSYLSINVNDDGSTTGHIYEYTTLQDTDAIKACADFYVANGYVSVVGNKASGMVAFSGYINELYLASEGRLLGYEVREDLTIAGITGTYNTLWFNLWDISGINKVKVTDKTDDNKSSKSTVDVYVNDSTSLLSPTYNKKLTVKTSRKYDIEYRSRFYYTYDSENEEYDANEVQVPMMFIQEGDNFNSFVTDIKNDNNIDASVSLSTTYLNKILDDYDTLIDVFIQNKDSMSSEQIISYLSQYDD